MKYIILSDSDNIENFSIPRQLSKINGEIIIQRTVRLLKENGVNEVFITSHDKRFDELGAIRYEPLSNKYNGKEKDEHKKGYWLDAFPTELMNEPITFLLGDVYYSDEAIKTIVNAETYSTLFFCTNGKLGYDKRYIKKHDEPLAYKVVDVVMFKEHIDRVKTMFDKGLTNRHPIMWELYRSINGLDINKHELADNYVAINDYTCDIDNVEDVLLIEHKLNNNNSQENKEEKIMWNIKVKISYNDYSPKITKVNGGEPEILLDSNGKEYFYAKFGDVLTVPDERGKYLVKERQLADIVSIEDKKNIEDIKPIEVETATVQTPNIETADVKVAKSNKKPAKKVAKK